MLEGISYVDSIIVKDSLYSLRDVLFLIKKIIFEFFFAYKWFDNIKMLIFTNKTVFLGETGCFDTLFCGISPALSCRM